MKVLLNPYERTLYTSVLIPPPEWAFDTAIATTFSMDPLVLLQSPVYLAFLATDEQTEPDPISLLEAVRRYSQQITVFVQKGRILIPQTAKPNPIYGLLEDMVVEANPKDGVFHPKVWILRYIKPEERSVMYRLVVLTRNLTMDNSWDLSLQLEGMVQNDKFPTYNDALQYFIKSLPNLSTSEINKSRRSQIETIAKEIRKVKWNLPDGFDEISFYLPGVKKYAWIPRNANKMVVISPFCKDEALKKLTTLAKQSVLISRPEELSTLKRSTRDHFEKCLYLDDYTESGDEESQDSSELSHSSGLHAKLYLFERDSDIELVIGSANATDAALISGINQEILISLTGKRSRVGSIDDILGEDGLKNYLMEFGADEEADIDVEQLSSQEILENARDEIIKSDLFVECSPGSENNTWNLAIENIPKFDQSIHIKVWPITLQPDSALKANNEERVEFRNITLENITGFIAFELKTVDPEFRLGFVLNVRIENLPERRNDAITRSIVNTSEKFMRYLMFLLDDESLNETSHTKSVSFKGFKWADQFIKVEDAPLLEDMVHNFARNPQKLKEITNLIEKISAEEKEIVPKDFLHLWEIFQEALEAQDE